MLCGEVDCRFRGGERELAGRASQQLQLDTARRPLRWVCAMAGRRHRPDAVRLRLRSHNMSIMRPAAGV